MAGLGPRVGDEMKNKDALRFWLVVLLFVLFSVFIGWYLDEVLGANF